MSFYNDTDYSHDRLGDGRSEGNFGPTCDDVNLALWGYLNYINGVPEYKTVKTFFGIGDLNTVTIIEEEIGDDGKIKKPGRIIKTTRYGSKFVTGDSTKAYNLYKIACKILKGEIKKSITAEFYKFRKQENPGDEQDLIFLKELEETETPQIKLKFYKVDYGNTKTGLSGAKLKIEKGSNIKSISKTNITSTGGNFDTIQITPIGSNPGKVTIKVTETKAPDGYEKLSNQIELTITYDKVSGDVTGISVDEKYKEYIVTSKNDGIGIIKLKNKCRKITDFTILKTDSAGTNKLQGTEFTLYLNNVESVKIGNTTIELSKLTNKGQIYTVNGISVARPINEDNDRIYIYGLKTNKNGEINISEIVATKTKNPIYVTITESESVAGYKKLPKELRLVLTYNGKWKLAERKGEGNLSNELNSKYWNLDSKNSVKVQLKNEETIDKLTILKKDLATGKAIDNVQFKLSFDNVNKIGNTEAKNGKLTLTQTVKNGKIEIENILIKDLSKNVTVQIEETNVPNGYKKINGKITVILKRDKSKLTGSLSKDGTVLDTEVNTNSLTVNSSAHTVTIDIKNHQTINLSGQVWLDGQIGEKNVLAPDGIKNDGKYLEGINVKLYSVKDAKVVSETKTDKDGKYSFKEILKTAEGYKVLFEYNGILYDDVGIKGDSKAAENENERTTLNNRFKTINANASNDKTKIEYVYNKDNKTSRFKSTITGTEPQNTVITAYTNVYKETTQNIDCGVLEKYFDLSLGTDVKSARVVINEKETTYNYAQVMNGALEDLTLDGKTQNNSSGTEYTLYLYYSDYNFRIDDYKTDMNGGITNKVNDQDDDNVTYDNLKELEVYVTYSIILKNQSKQEGTVETFDYYYDSKYTIYEIPAMEDYTVERNDDEHKITFTHKGTSTLNDSNDYRREVNVTFKVNKDEAKNVITGKFSNVGEITSYSTPIGGFIDKDSAPGNANITFENGTPKVGQYEDDTDEAAGLKLSVKDDLVREISGNVFEDADKNGKNDDNNTVNDVIVQLIEIKTIGDQKYEYIWQETRSGSNEVRTTTRNGYDPSSKYTNAEKTDGKYQFKDFIPGNYIIRFIYGDGTTYDLTETVKKYNGQDYKSTIDEHYKEEWYNSTKYTETSSVAVDNEARRLEVMAYSTKIDTTKGTELKDKTKDMLDATWMCAETSKINVGVEDNKSNKNINFGLAQRPNTKLVLEKHITSLKITPQGTGVQPIVEARLNIDKILGGSVGSSDVEGIKTGLSIIKSTRTERGFWKVETDIEELAQGAKVELEYTYVIKNEGDEDYLSSDVIGEYTTNIGKDKNSNGTDDYVEYLKGASETAKASVKGQRNNSGSYLGQYYYTGTKGTNDASVLSTVTKIEDNLNNNLKFVNTTNPSFTSKNGGEKVVYDANGNDNKEKIETVLENIELFTTLGKGERDTTKTANLETTLSASSKEIAYPTYIGEITEYTNAAGRKDMESTPTNLSYVHSEDTNKTMENSNEADEFWGEKLIVSKPTGEDKQAPVQAIIIATTAIATIGVGIILIKKFVLKK